jgi:hypothetical protein
MLAGKDWKDFQSCCICIYVLLHYFFQFPATQNGHIDPLEINYDIEQPVVNGQVV